MIAFLVAQAIYCGENYCGQADPLYAKHCLACHYLRRWFQIRDAYAWMQSGCVSEDYKQRARNIVKHWEQTK
jgi:hypothetical protein